MAYSSLAIANEVLKSAEARGLALTNMQLIKLMYIAHGWALALLDHPLVDEKPQAWQHGPVFPRVYREFRDAGSSAIRTRALNPFSGVEESAALSDDERAIINNVVESYGKFHAFTLSERTHQVGTPWFQIWNEGSGKFAPIPDDVIKAHYRKLNEKAA